MHSSWWLFLSAFLINLALVTSASPPGVTVVSDQKDLKKFLKSKTNILVLYGSNSDPTFKKTLSVLSTLGQEMQGEASFGAVNCDEDKETKKMCKYTAKVRDDQKFVLKHYSNGEFTKDYDRVPTAKSIKSFMLDPKGEPAWEEDETAQDVLHLTDATFDGVINKGQPTLVFFYAPWCGHCKKAKPEFAAAATAIKSSGKSKGKRGLIIAGLDANSRGGQQTGQRFNVTGYPTIKYFDNGKFVMDYAGGREKDAVVAWLSNPTAPPPPPPPEPKWSDADNGIAHLTDATFDAYIAEHSGVLLMFYAPWCGHCKAAKPEFENAVNTLKAKGIDGALAAIDATENPVVAKKFDVKGYPTILYFDGNASEAKYKYEGGRKAPDFVEFIQNPRAPPPPEPAWKDEALDVMHLTDKDFHRSLTKVPHAVVMFYAPWCGHCKNFKPHLLAAATAVKNNKKVAIAAVDCTVETAICKEFDVKGYPTVKHFKLGKGGSEYTAARTKQGVLSFLEGVVPGGLKLPASELEDD